MKSGIGGVGDYDSTQSPMRTLGATLASFASFGVAYFARAKKHSLQIEWYS
jgi:hypothetical protein